METRCKAVKAKTTPSTFASQAQGNADAGGGTLEQEEEKASVPTRKDGSVSVNQGGGDGNDNADLPPRKPSPSVEVVLARLLTDTLASLTRDFEDEALETGEVRCKRKGVLLAAHVEHCCSSRTGGTGRDGATSDLVTFFLVS